MQLYNDPAYINFLKNNQGRGAIKVRLITGGGALPIENAHVVISKTIDDKYYKLAEGYTDACGISEFHDLPCLDKSYSLDPHATPYAGVMYDLDIIHPDFGRGHGKAPVFDEITTVHEVCPINDFGKKL